MYIYIYWGVSIHQAFVWPTFGSSNIAIGRKNCFGIAKKLLISFWRMSISGIFSAQKMKFLLSISSVNVTKSAGTWGFGHIYWRNG